MPWLQLVPFEKSGAVTGSAELECDAKATARERPADIPVRAPNTATPTFHAALVSDLNVSVGTQAVNAHRTEVEARLVLAARAHIDIFDPEVRCLLVDEVLEGHEQIVDIDVGQALLEILRKLIGFKCITF